jgi:hypothetical protein
MVLCDRIRDRLMKCAGRLVGVRPPRRPDPRAAVEPAELTVPGHAHRPCRIDRIHDSVTLTGRMPVWCDEPANSSRAVSPGREASMAGETWFYAVDGSRQGPVPGSALRQLARQGMIGPEDLVWREGLADWVPARTLKGLFDGPGMPPPVPPPLPPEADSIGAGDRPRRGPATPWLAAGGLGLAALFFAMKKPDAPPPPAEPGALGVVAPAAPPAPVAPAVDEAFNRRKAATLRAWTAMQQADGQVGAGQYELPSSKFAATATLYSQIDLADVDAALRDHVLDSIRGYSGASRVFADFEQELASVYGDAAAFQQFGGLIGRASNGDDPDTGEGAGNLLFGLVGAAAAEERAKEIQAKYQGSIDVVFADLATIAGRDETLATELTQRYGEAFTDYY